MEIKDSKLRVFNYSSFIFTIISLIGLSALGYTQIYLSGDVTWYLIAGERLLDGQSNSEGFFDTNPPMLSLIHI